ncbi:DNA polymerase III subunit beta [Candidatus Dojkabacteria bacterium]|uniref:Beta sliding clamp n=1 Tax=Candidatus Dojkabacteria bacterium TaxID=2099670 RepID=A0A955IFE1_9BACT|nr:DNA polymerase III subunit beta [Candidatus Dojkabacteria bacterium]
MKLTLNHKKLAQALSYTSKSVSQKPNIPILSNVKLESSEDSLKLLATNLDMGIKMWIPCSIEESGSTTVNAKYISDYVSVTNSSSEDITIEQKDNNLKLSTDLSKASFTTIPSEEFPALPTLGVKPMFEINAHEFVKSMEKTIFACSTDLSAGRIQQSGVLFELNLVNSEIDFIGLDGFRLSKRKCSVSNIDKDLTKEEIIVPARYLQELSRILSDFPEVEKLEVYLSESGSQIIFKIDQIEFSIRLLEGPYPDYKRIMPDDHSFEFEVDKKELESAIKITNTFARGNLGNKTLFDFDIENNSIKLQSAVAEVGEGETNIEVSNASGESDLKTAYTLRYLQDIVNHIEGERIIFETKGPLAASVFKDSEDENFVHLVMPMRRE